MQGLLGSSIVGLQTELDRANFSAAVERLVLGDASTRARCYPISIAWPSAEQHLAARPLHGERVTSQPVFCVGVAMKKPLNPASGGLQEPLEKTEAVTAEIERAANHALVIGTVLAHEIPAELQMGEVAQAIEQTEELEQQLVESAEKLADVSSALEQEIAKRRAVTRELTETLEHVDQLVDDARKAG